MRVKFLYRGRSENGDALWLRQLPGGKPFWGDVEFVFDKNCNKYDWFVVYDDLPPENTERFSRRTEQLKCPPEKTLLITSEPSTIKVYGKKYTDQFGVVLTTQEPWAIRHKNAIHSQCGYRWFYGIGSNKIKTFDEIKDRPPIKKSQLVSTVCSSKKQKNTVHAVRYEFTQKLKAQLPELEVFGRGVRDIDDKADALDAYKYHVVIENFCGMHHWSEKLADTFLGHSLPLYYGCPNIEDYFPSDSFIKIDPYKTDESIDKIKSIITNNEYEKRMSAISEARRRVIEEYNVFAVIAKIIQSNITGNLDNSTEEVDNEIIKSRRSARDASFTTCIGYYLERYSIKFKHSTGWHPKYTSTKNTAL